MNPTGFFNCDETGLSLNPRPLKVVDTKEGKKSILAN